MIANPKIKIALVDDHQMFLDGLVSVLSNQKEFEIVFVENNPKKALLKIKTNTPDLLISDVSMPEMSGLEFVKKVKQDYPEVKILLLSMYESLQTYQNIDGYLLKETSKEELIKTIIDIVLHNKKHFAPKEITQDTFHFKNTILTDREKQIIQLIALEYTNPEIAKKLSTSIRTIESHRKNIYYKLRVTNTAGLIIRATYLGVIK